MPRTRKDDAPVLIVDPRIESRGVELGDHTVVFESHRADVDPAPLFRGLPDDRCQCRRSLRALELLAEESASARVQFLSAARRGLYALVTGDLAAAERARGAAVAAGVQAGEADTEAIDRTLSAGIARQAGNRGALAREAAMYESFGAAEAVLSISA
jgi:hypothetical protein